MEDTHIAQCNINGEVSIFGVFDGHGGREGAIYVQKHFIRTITANKNFINKNYEKALYETFLGIQ